MASGLPLGASSALVEASLHVISSAISQSFSIITVINAYILPFA